jgi:hypothetical protein
MGSRMSRCRGLHPAGDWAGAFASYGSGARCQSPRSAERVPTMQAALLVMAQQTE